MHYQEKLDNIFAKGSLWQHRTFRTVFDPYSSEYDDTSMEKKVEYLRKCNDNDLKLSELVDGYKEFYLEENKPNVIKSLEDGLIRLTTKILDEK
jgi:hypothetical protein